MTEDQELFAFEAAVRAASEMALRRAESPLEAAVAVVNAAIAAHAALTTDSAS